jgi:apolipoprotein N-acyltransferase
LKRYQFLGLSLLSGILLSAAWPVSSLTFIIFFAFVPLLFIAESNIKRNHFFLYAFITLLIWNALTTWWIWNSSAVGAIGAIIPNALLMCLPWLSYFGFRKRFGKKAGYCSLIAFWMLFEYIHLNWQLTWPWLSLGNVFAAQINWVQWYEYTGVGGGTLWVLLVNILLYECLRGANKKIVWIKAIQLLVIGLLVIVPIILSEVYHKWPFGLMGKETIENNVVIVQPNIDPYQKFNPTSTAQQIQTLVSLSEQQIDSSTKLVLWPETAMSASVPIDEIQSAGIYQPVMQFVNRHPNITLLTGIETYKILGAEKTSTSAHKTQDGFYYDSYNAAISMKANQPMQFYIKSKLVPGVETLPSFLNFLGPVFEKFGGTTGGYARDTATVAFKHEGNPFVTAPAICYESVYGEYVASYVAKGANIITILTNDGWWGNTPGHKQHLAYAKLRAVETRRWVARSANTGISAVIDEYGNVLQQTKWDEATAFKYSIPARETITFYVKHGDYLYQFFSIIGLLMIGWNFVLWIKKKTQRKQGPQRNAEQIA